MSVSVSNIAAMQAVQTYVFTAQSSIVQTVFVETVGDFFRFVRSGTATVVANQVVASRDGLGQWHRMAVPNPTYLAANYWAIDPTNGNDENQGWGATQAAAELVPLKTRAELDRRLAGNPGFDRTVIFSIMGNIPIADSGVCQNVTTRNADGYPMFVGKIGTALTTGTVANYTAKNVGAGTGATYLMDLTSAATYVGKMVQDEDRRYCFVLAAESANVARISTPLYEQFGTVATQGYPAEPTNLVNGKAFGVYDLYTFPSHPFPSATMYGVVAQLKVGSGITSNFDNPDLGGSGTYYLKSMVEGSDGGNGTSGSWTGGFTFWGGCLFRNGGSGGVTFLHHSGNFQCCTFLGVRASFLNGSGARLQEECILYNSRFLMDETSSIGGILGSTPRLQLGIFATTAAAVTGGRFRLPSDGGTVYGANNTSTLFNIPQGSSYSLPKAGCTAATSGTVLSVGGTSKVFADIPFVNTTNNASISDGP